MHLLMFCASPFLPLQLFLGLPSGDLTSPLWPFPSIFPSADQENTTALIDLIPHQVPMMWEQLSPLSK